MKQQYCDNNRITFALQGLLWITKKDYSFMSGEKQFSIELQYKNHAIDVKFSDENMRDTEYEKARLLLSPPAQDDEEEFHPRAMKLIRKKKNFLVVAYDEPYFKEVYDMIRRNEMENHRWTTDDELNYLNATEEQ
jgi:hypothetical protein